MLLEMVVRGEPQDRWWQQRVSVHRRIRHRIEVRIERIKFFLGHRVELVAVTDRTLQRQAEKNSRECLGTVNGIPDQHFVVDRSPFARRNITAIKARGDLLIHRRIGNQIPRQLLDRELVERQILVDRVDHVFTIRPHRPFVVEMQTMRVTVTRSIQPDPALVLAITR